MQERSRCVNVPSESCGLQAALGKGYRLIITLTGLALAVSALPAHGQDRAQRQYELKAALLYNFLKFVEWPADTGTTRTVCVLGEDPFGPALESIAGRTAAGRTVETKRLARVEEVAGCHLLFISSSEANRLPQVLQVLADSSVLTVAEMRDFARRGGMVGLSVRRNKIHIAINVEAYEQARLTISSQLLSVASVIR